MVILFAYIIWLNLQFNENIFNNLSSKLWHHFFIVTCWKDVLEFVGNKIKIEVRGKKYDAKVSALPFYKKNYVK